MIPKSRDNRIPDTIAHHDNIMKVMHLPMLTQIQRISGSSEMRPFATIFESVGYPLEKSSVSKGFSEKMIIPFILKILKERRL